MAIGKYRDDFAKSQELQTRGQEAAGKIAENDPTNQAIKTSTEVVPYGIGIATGTGIGHYVFGNKEADQQLGQEVKSLANRRGINPTIKEEQLNALLRRRNMTDVGQFAAPGLLFGAGQFTRDYLSKIPQDKNAQDIVNSIGLGENAAAASLGTHQLITTLNSLRKGRGIDSGDIAKIRSDAMPTPSSGPSAPAAPAALPPPEGEPVQHSERLKLAASAAGGKPSSTKAGNVEAIKRNLTAENMADVAQSLKLSSDATRPQILQRLRELSRTGGKLALPLAAGALAYEAMNNPAQAEDGSDVSPGAAGKAVAVGTGVAVGAGLNKLLSAAPAIGEVAGKVLGPELMLASPDMMHAANAILDKIGLGNPQLNANASGISQVPDRGERGLLGGRDLNAANLQIPTQAQNPGTTENPESMSFDQQIADLQRIFGDLDQQGQSPVQTAGQSYAAANAPVNPSFAAPQMPQNALLRSASHI